MFASSISGRRAAAVAAVVVGTAIHAGCDDPVQPVPVPDVSALRLFMVLDPDEDTQMVLVQHTSGLNLTGLTGTVSVDGREVASQIARDGTPEQLFEERVPCGERYGVLIDSPRCLTLALSPAHGATYEVRVTAGDQPEASATTTVPHPFSIVSHDVKGSPPGTAGLRATWTRSAGVYRYVVAIRGTSAANCPTDRCNRRWFAVTTDTTLQTVVAGEYFDQSTGPWFLDVYAMNEDLFTHLMTGTSATFFPVPPAQNVRGGFGAVGAWVRRSVALQ